MATPGHIDPSPKPDVCRVRSVGLIGGVVAAVLVFLIYPIEPHATDLMRAGRPVAAVAALMAVFWVTEAIPIPATALLPIVLFPLIAHGAIPVEQAAAPYGDDLIFLFMGGFMIGQAMQRWGLHRRIALRTIGLVGTKPASLVAGFMLASALLSMWVSNTATVVMMLPIALSIIDLVHRPLHPSPDHSEEYLRPKESDVAAAGSPAFAPCLLLGTAYAASIGGIGTLIGTPPNLLLAAFLKDEYGVDISFARWMMVGLPLVAVFLPLAWLVLTRWAFPIPRDATQADQPMLSEHVRELGPMTHAERRVLIVFAATALMWMTRPLLADWTLPDGTRPLAGLSDAGIAIAAAVALFVLPAHRLTGRRLLDWAHAASIPWGVLVLFGGGLSLASAIKITGVAALIGDGVSSLHALPLWVLMLVITTVVIFLTELTSNTATTATLLPILGAVAIGLDVNPVLLTVPLAMAASCAFMMPVATPPNAIVFGSGQITIGQMCKAGIYLNAIGIALVMLVMYTLGSSLLAG
ncbi:MAG: SLC13 family permease [Phycisphaerae bacterium]